VTEPAGPRVLLGAIAGAHGVRGLVRIKSFTDDPGDLTAYGPLGDETGARTFQVTITGSAKGGGAKGFLVARIAGIDDRAAAQALKGTRLTVPRGALPALGDEETYYHADLIGLAVEDLAGQPVGTVSTVYDFGGGDLLEIDRAAGAPLVIPFTKAAVPQVDLAGQRLVIAPPEEVEAPERRSDG